MRAPAVCMLQGMPANVLPRRAFDPEDFDSINNYHGAVLQHYDRIYDISDLQEMPRLTRSRDLPDPTPAEDRVQRLVLEYGVPEKVVDIIIAYIADYDEEPSPEHRSVLHESYVQLFYPRCRRVSAHYMNLLHDMVCVLTLRIGTAPEKYIRAFDTLCSLKCKLRGRCILCRP